MTQALDLNQLVAAFLGPIVKHYVDEALKAAYLKDAPDNLVDRLDRLDRQVASLAEVHAADLLHLEGELRAIKDDYAPAWKLEKLAEATSPNYVKKVADQVLEDWRQNCMKEDVFELVDDKFDGDVDDYIGSKVRNAIDSKLPEAVGDYMEGADLSEWDFSTPVRRTLETLIADGDLTLTLG